MTQPISPRPEAPSLSHDLSKEYQLRFLPLATYRRKVWSVLTRDFFQKYIPSRATVLDLGCGWGEFINQIQAERRLGMDLNPDSPRHLDAGIEFHRHDCSLPWPIAPGTLDVVFTSNFFEHLPGKLALRQTLAEVRDALRSGGTLICMGPNIKFLPGAYWDFWDHEVALTELALKEILEITGFEVTECVDRFLPYTMVGSRQPALWKIRLYLKLRFAWKIFGRQFLVVARKKAD
jgi:SAM-dependent methyltransferase